MGIRAIGDLENRLKTQMQINIA